MFAANGSPDLSLLYQENGLPGLLTRFQRTRSLGADFLPLQYAQIVQLACLEPVAKGLHITHWSSDDLAPQVVMDGIVPSISVRTVRRILHEVDLQPPSAPLLENQPLGSAVQTSR